jgi:hypothetical protein
MTAAGLYGSSMLARKPKMLVTVALANKMARIIWALLVPQRPFRVAGSNAGPYPHFRHWRVARRGRTTTTVKRSVGLLR